MLLRTAPNISEDARVSKYTRSELRAKARLLISGNYKKELAMVALTLSGRLGVSYIKAIGMIRGLAI